MSLPNEIPQIIFQLRALGMETLMHPPGVRSVIKQATKLQESTKCSLKSR